jgi:glycosyltransferase involved in cell wall biosynthesis
MQQLTKPLISIILPVHNAGNYLKRCLETLINQTLKEIEIICIVDAPTDGSDLVVKEFSDRDNRIKVIYNEDNLNISESRNRGLKIAIGEYIGFSDHDDWRELNMYEKLYEIAKKENADIIISNSYLVRNDVNEIHKYNNITREGIIGSIILPMWSRYNPNFLSKSAWASIYRSDLIFSNNIYFPDKRVFYEEDTLFNLQAFIHATRIFHLNEAFYYWVKHESATSDKPVSDLIERHLNYFSFIENELSTNRVLSKFHIEFSILISTYIFSYLESYNKLSNKEKRRLSNFCFNLSKKHIDNYLGINDYNNRLVQFYILKYKLIFIHVTMGLNKSLKNLLKNNG